MAKNFMLEKILVVIGLIAGLMFPMSNSYPQVNSEVAWQLVVISGEPACSGYHYYMVQKYQEISQRYLDLYQIENSSYQPACMTSEKYFSDYEKPHDLDLIILAYDREQGREELHAYQTGGLYMHRGDDLSTNHTIIFCDCPNFEYSDPVWVLSHELSHFVLNYLGYDLQVVEEEIHSLDRKYDLCVEGGYDESCSLVKRSIETDRANWVVMAPYEPAIGKPLPNSNNNKAEIKLLYQNQMILEVTNWWLQKDITDKNYLKSLQILSGKGKDEELKSAGILAESPLKILTEPPNHQKETDLQETQYGITNHVLKMTPFSDVSEKISSEEQELFMEWLKVKANSWANGEIHDKKFLNDLHYIINSPKADLYLNYLEALSVEELIEKGLEYEEKNEFRNALSYYDRALAKSLDSGEIDITALILKASALNALGRYHEASLYLDEALDIEPENKEILKEKAFSLAQLGQLEEAKFYYELAIDLE